MQDAIIQLIPLMIIQIIYAAVTFALRRKLDRDPWLLTILTLIPGIGMLVFLVTIFRALFLMIDRIKALEGKVSATTFD